MPETPLPATRWAAAGGGADSGYATRFAQLVADGDDVYGEGRLADVLVGRGARILDVGSGMGRIAAYLRGCGHDVVAAEPDPALVEQSQATYPELEVLPHQILELTPELVGAPVDLVVCVGNVMPYVAAGTEVACLARLRSLLAPAGRILVGFHLRQGPSTARVYTPEEFVEEVETAGLAVQHRFGGYALEPANDEYAVWVLGEQRPG
ncbi:MAG: class I SAM-dependent methyltransferase [Nocardioidaceae bacterium]|nr:class I SAM-dependent methyltransferase [Nocardioidaceae bacterium]MCL2612059.1 class I SAM-dependent methyltransferase [Nocardioidaceae bacterium]